MKGTVKKLIQGKGYGFITKAEGGDIFFHKKDLAHGERFENYREGDAVEFEEGASKDGRPRAEDVERV